jgi:hypothetical protein
MVQWKRQEQTQLLVDFLHHLVSEIQAEWLNKSYVGEDESKSSVLNTVALATARAYMSIIEGIENLDENTEERNQNDHQ